VTSEVWTARYPDLAGKVALVAGDGDGLVAVVAALASNGAPVCVVSSERATVDAATTSAEANGAMGVVSSPGDPATWQRVLPHAEQRLGPLDVVVVLGSAPMRRVVTAAVVPDMAARRRGVVVEVGEEHTGDDLPAHVRTRAVVIAGATRPNDIAATVALCASDVVAARHVAVRIAD
jgi:NADP-dependent 3-hydroxy acid dehydrogenase YdfG